MSQAIRIFWSKIKFKTKETGEQELYIGNDGPEML